MLIIEVWRGTTFNSVPEVSQCLTLAQPWEGGPSRAVGVAVQCGEGAETCQRGIKVFPSQG